jgi:hypothetical protein
MRWRSRRRLASGTVALVLLLLGCADPFFDEGRVPISGFRPISPPLELTPILFNPFKPPEPRRLDIPPVNSRQPLISWEPGLGVHRRYGPSNLSPRQPFLRLPADTIVDMRYDLRIWPMRPGGSVPVYSRDGIDGTAHRVEPPLEADQTYCWSVRARFSREDGRSAVSEWSHAMWPEPSALGISGHFAERFELAARHVVRERGYIPSEICYRFRTPAG